MKKAIYTAIFGKYDILKDPEYINKDYHYICFTDQNFKSDIWQVENVNSSSIGAKKTSRMVKILSHMIMQHYEFTIYQDGSMVQIDDANYLLDNMKTDIAFIDHPDRNCVYDELEACIRLKKDDRKLMVNQVSRYRQNGWKDNSGLYQCGLMARKKSIEVTQFELRWWEEVSKWSYRDQLSVNYCLQGLNVDLFDVSLLETHFKLNRHKK